MVAVASGLRPQAIWRAQHALDDPPAAGAGGCGGELSSAALVSVACAACCLGSRSMRAGAAHSHEVHCLQYLGASGAQGG